MKIRNGFVSNSSSSSFIVLSKRYIEDPKEIEDYLKTHDEAVLFFDSCDLNEYGVYIRIDRKIIDNILNGEYPNILSYMIVDDYFHIGEDSKITEDMVGTTLEAWSGWDGEGCPFEFSEGWYEDYDTVEDFFNSFR